MGEVCFLFMRIHVLHTLYVWIARVVSNIWLNLMSVVQLEMYFLRHKFKMYFSHCTLHVIYFLLFTDYRSPSINIQYHSPFFLVMEG